MSMQDGRESIIVTGGSGLIGTGLLHRLANTYHLFSWDRQEPPPPLPRHAEHADLDITSDAEVEQRVLDVSSRTAGRVAAVVHLAAFYDFSGAPSDMYDKVTVEGTRRVLRLLQKHNVDVGRFIFTSTMLVHAPTEPGKPINEDSPIAPMWAYPASKVKTEKVIHEEHGDIPVTILRIAGVYNELCHSIPLSQQIYRIRERLFTSHVFPGDISHGQSFVHLDDIVESLALSIERRDQLPAEHVLLIGEEGRPMSYEQLQQAFGRLIHSDEDWHTYEIPKALARTGAWVEEKLPGFDEFIKPWMIDRADDHYELDISRAKEQLGWHPQHRLQATLPAMVHALQVDPVGWYHLHKLKLPREFKAAG